jgi:hypothetical protein
MSDFTVKLKDVCLAQFARWDNGAGRETEGTDTGAAKDYFRFVADYWKSIGVNNRNGRTIVDGVRPPWSAAFVSFCVKKAASDAETDIDFKFAEAHRQYIKAAMDRTDGINSTHAYAARRPENYSPKVGDIICAGRESAKFFTYDDARREQDNGYPSHGDIVVAVADAKLTTIGGNIIHNVDDKMPKIDSNGRLKKRIVDGDALPWICVLECLV